MSNSTWRYGCEKQDDGLYYLVEVFPSLGANTDPVTVSSISPEELAKWLEQAAKDIRKHGAVGEEWAPMEYTETVQSEVETIEITCSPESNDKKIKGTICKQDA